MTIGQILRNSDPKVFSQINSSVRKSSSIPNLILKLDYRGIEREIERRIDVRLRKSELERFITTELAYRQDKGDNRIVRKTGDSMMNILKMRAPHLIAS